MLQKWRIWNHIKNRIKTETKFPSIPIDNRGVTKDCARFFKMSAKTALAAAERLYNLGYLSYPRTETDRFAKETDFKSLLEVHKQDPRWEAIQQSF